MKPYIILILLVAIAYANSLQNEFVWDDTDIIVNNPKINLSISEIPSVFTTSLWGMAGFSERQDYYRPVIFLLYVLNYKIWGLNPFGFHLIHILIHLINAMILYRIGLILFNDKLISLIGASVFAVHPVNNEPVGWVSAGDVVFGFFIILSIYFFLKEKRYLSWAAFFLALLSKEAAVMLPFALIIFSICRNGFKKGVIAITPYLALSGIYLFIRMNVVDIVLVLGADIKQPIFIQVLTMAVAAFDYIKLLIIPYPLSPFYPAKWHASVFEPKVILAIIVLISISFLAFKIRKDRVMLFLLISPFIMLAPVIWMVNMFMAGEDNVYIAERYLYVPAMFFSIFAPDLLVKVFNDRARRYLNIGWILIIIIFIYTTASSSAAWKNDITLFKKIIEKSPDAAFAHNNLGNVYADQGRLDEAIKEYLTALKIKPYYASVHNNLGTAYYEKGNVDMAIKEYMMALKIKPDYADAHNNLGAAYYEQGKIDEAIKEYLASLKVRSDFAPAHYNLGRAYRKKGLEYNARKEFEMVLKLKPDFAPAKKAIESLDKDK